MTTETTTTVPEPCPCGGQGDPFPHELDGTVCHEDEPCWDCSTMGNGICGDVELVAVVTVPAERVTTTAATVEPPQLPTTGTTLNIGLLGALLLGAGIVLCRAARREEQS